MTTLAEEFAALSDEHLVLAFWYSDVMDAEELHTLEAELEKRGIDPFKWKKP